MLLVVKGRKISRPLRLPHRMLQLPQAKLSLKVNEAPHISGFRTRRGLSHWEPNNEFHMQKGYTTRYLKDERLMCIHRVLV